MVVSSGIRNNFINVPENKRADAISKSIETLQEDFFLDESIAKDLLESIAFAYGWEINADDMGGADSGEKALISQLIQKAANIGKLCDNIAFAAQSGIGKSEITKEINDALIRLMSKADNIDKLYAFYESVQGKSKELFADGGNGDAYKQKLTEAINDFVASVKSFGELKETLSVVDDIEITNETVKVIDDTTSKFINNSDKIEGLNEITTYVKGRNTYNKFEQAVKSVAGRFDLHLRILMSLQRLLSILKITKSALSRKVTSRLCLPDLYQRLKMCPCLRA
jgi:hypothetical protein